MKVRNGDLSLRKGQFFTQQKKANMQPTIHTNTTDAQAVSLEVAQGRVLTRADEWRDAIKNKPSASKERLRLIAAIDSKNKLKEKKS